MEKENNRPEDSIERLFQQKAEEYDIPYRESDWQKLEKRLDIEDQRRSLARKSRWLIAASIALFALLGYFTYDNYLQINRLNEQLSSQSESELLQEIPSQRQPDDIDGKGENGEEETPDQVFAETGPDRTGNNGNGETADDRTSGAVTDPPADTQADGYRSFLVTEQAAGDLYIPEISCSHCTLSSPAVHERQPGPTLARASVPDKINNNTGTAERNDPPAIAGNTVERPDATGFAVGLTASPDLSTAGSFSNFSDVGYKIGVTVEYKPFRNFSITGGLIQSDVKYRASGDDYRPPPGYWSDGIAADETIARCLIIDIPLNLKYDFMQFNRSRLYVSGGVSSYIMLNEDYRFNYGYNRNGNREDSWSGKTGTRHWMSSAGFSIGYELDIHRNWSLRAEPFIRFPVREVGWGNVELYSMGSFFSINYKL